MSTPSEYGRVMFHGKPVTRRQRQALRAVEDTLGMAFVVPQGSWQPKTDYSATTHMGAGVADLWLPRMEDETWYKHALHVVRKVGRQAAFGRGPWCDMPYHFHVIDLDTTGVDPAAIAQVADYRAGRDGLSGGSPDPFPWRPSPILRWRYKP